MTLFILFNTVGFGVSALCLIRSHDLLGLTSRTADNISANVIGVGVGTIVGSCPTAGTCSSTPIVAIALTPEPPLTSGSPRARDSWGLANKPITQAQCV